MQALSALLAQGEGAQQTQLHLKHQKSLVETWSLGCAGGSTR